MARSAAADRSRRAAILRGRRTCSAPGGRTVAVPRADRATSYNLYWSESTPVTTSSAVVKGVASPYVQTGLANFKKIYYAVSAVNEFGESGLSAEASGTPVAAPLAVSSLSVEPGDARNTVQWAAVQHADSYKLYWSETSPVTKSSAAIANVVSPYVHTGLTNGKTLYYAVTAINGYGESELSSEVGATPVAPVPAAPETLNATPGDTTVTLAWSAVSRADAYNIYWAKTAGVVPGGTGVTKIANVLATSYQHVGLTNLDTYFYVVTAVNTGGEGLPSPEASARPLPPAPGAPTNVVATAGDAKVLLAWSPTQDATSYNVYWSNTAGVVPGAAGVTQIPGVTRTTLEHVGLTNGNTYYYVVSAVGPGGESTRSSEVSARPLPPVPPAPLGLTAIAPKDALQVTLQWFDVTDYPSAGAPIPLGYNLYRGLDANLASYYKDPSRASRFTNVTAPFVDATVTSATTYYYVVTSFVPGFPEVESVPSGVVSATTGRAGGGGGGGGGDSGYGNNLSFPLIFADGYGLTGLKIAGSWPGVGPFDTLPAFDFNTGLRPLSTETLTTFPFYDSRTAVTIGGITYYPQATASTWQAEWRNNAGGATMEAIVDWGDALLSRTYTTSSIVRIETALKQDATVPGVTDTMSAYKMVLVSGQQTTEMQGTDKTVYASAGRNIFAVNARLKIEKIATGGGADVVVFDRAIWEGFGTTTEGEGGAPTTGSYSAELNVSGTLVYGYNFRIGQITGISDKTGQYRITFSLDPEATIGTTKVPNHVKMINKLDAGATLAPDGLSTSVVITVN